MEEQQKILRRAAMDCLARREHSWQELFGRLMRHEAAEADPARVTTVLDQLVADRLQSDERFTESAVRYYSQRGKGPVWIRHWLAQKGVDAALAQACLADESGDWRARARLTREKRFGPGLPGTPAERARQSRFLSRRGFSADQVRWTLQAMDD